MMQVIHCGNINNEWHFNLMVLFRIPLSCFRLYESNNQYYIIKYNI